MDRLLGGPIPDRGALMRLKLVRAHARSLGALRGSPPRTTSVEALNARQRNPVICDASGSGEGEGAADERNMREGLRKVAEQAPRVGVVLLGQQPQIVSQTEQAFE